MVALARRRKPGPIMPMELDWIRPIEQHAPLSQSLAAVIWPGAGTGQGGRDLLTGITDAGTDLTPVYSPVVGPAHSYNGSSSYSDFGNDRRYEITTGGITLATWFRVEPGHSFLNQIFMIRRGVSGGDASNYSLTGLDSAGTQPLVMQYTTSPGNFVTRRTTPTLQSLGIDDGNWHLISASWQSGAMHTTSTVAIDGVEIATSSLGGTDGTHVPNVNQRLGINALYLSSWGYHSSSTVGPSFIWRRKLALPEHQQLFAPQTRWSMIRARGTKRYFVPATTVPTIIQRRTLDDRVGSRSAIAC